MISIGIGDGRGQQFLEIHDDGEMYISDKGSVMTPVSIRLTNPRGLLKVLKERLGEE